MKRYRFRLQTVLERREAFEKEKLGELAEVRSEEAQEVERLHALNRQLEQSRDQIEDALRRGLTPMEVMLRDNYSEATANDILVQELTIEAVRQRVEAKRLEVVEAMKERKVLEALKEKQEREYMLTCMRYEQNELDEIASVRYARGM